MHETNFWARMKHLAHYIFAAAVALLFASAAVAAAEDMLAEAQVAAGRVWYEKYCTQCHGPGGAPGTAVSPDTKEKVDLRHYVARHGGKFPAGEWIAVVEQTEPRAPHADVWQEILKAQPQTISQRPVARGVVVLIAEYIMSVQTK